MLFRDGRMVTGQQNPEGDANEEEARPMPRCRKVVLMAGGTAFMLNLPSR
jgi:hypothetical protein